MFNWRLIALLALKLKRKKSYSFLWQKPFKNRKIKTSQSTTPKRQQKIRNNDCGPLRTVSWSNNSCLTCEDKPVCGPPTFPLTANTMQSKGHTLKYNIRFYWVSFTTLLSRTVSSCRSSGGVVDKQEVRCSIPGLVATIAEIGYLLLPSRNMAEMSLKRRKTS